ncbi:DNA polymerase IV [Candidatus Fermentibacteria bacterium]|nr:DNA polymerase IV [Candidatus Fermentibacteria bacterium]
MMIPAQRVILHLDLDAFFCSVEELRDPTLRGARFAVGGTPRQRGVVASCSYPARMFGVRSAMPMAQALRACPDLLVIPGHYEAYDEMSQAVMESLRAVSPAVEQVSIDEAFVDITHGFEDAQSLAQRLQADVRDRLGLPCSVGVASNKLVAKIATEVGKASAPRGYPPNAVTIVPPGTEGPFLAPLPVRMLWGVGPKTEERLAQRGVKTIGDLALCPVDELVEMFGQYGRELNARARGSDTSPVVSTHDIKSISQEVTFPRDVADSAMLRGTIRELADTVGRRLRKAGMAATVVKLKLRWADFSTISRQTRLKEAADGDELIGGTALALFARAWKPARPIRLVGVGVSGLVPPVRQLQLWEETSTETPALQRAVDTVRDRFGTYAIRRGSSLRNAPR